jgi:hypothetical protein
METEKVYNEIIEKKVFGIIMNNTKPEKRTDGETAFVIKDRANLLLELLEYIDTYERGAK